jgi:hypothetical protein
MSITGLPLFISALWALGASVPASFPATAFGASGPLYQQIVTVPKISSNSAKEAAFYFGSKPYFTVGFIDSNSAQAKYDYTFPVYPARLTDPLVKVVCQWCSDSGVSIHLPALARQAGGSDGHLSALQPNGVEYDFWGVSSNPPYANGSTLKALTESSYNVNGTSRGPRYVAPAFNSAGATAGGVALSVGQIYPSELAAGVIAHAIAISLPCSNASWVFPATQTTGICANGQGAPLGTRLWWKMSDNSTNALNAPNDLKTVLRALHHWGGFFIDGGGLGSRLANSEPIWLYGNGVNNDLSYAQHAPGWQHVVGSNGVDRWLLQASGNAIGVTKYLVFLDPCVTNGTC